ncbi:uncharacterized protein METZ01_LOCUS64382, partial [marine metagenome]
VAANYERHATDFLSNVPPVGLAPLPGPVGEDEGVQAPSKLLLPKLHREASHDPPLLQPSYPVMNGDSGHSQGIGYGLCTGSRVFLQHRNYPCVLGVQLRDRHDFGK